MCVLNLKVQGSIRPGKCSRCEVLWTQIKGIIFLTNRGISERRCETCGCQTVDADCRYSKLVYLLKVSIQYSHLVSESYHQVREVSVCLMLISLLLKRCQYFFQLILIQSFHYSSMRHPSPRPYSPSFLEQA